MPLPVIVTRRSTPTLHRCAVAASLVAVLALVGCGQKGPLFLPQDKLDEIKRKRDERRSDETPARTGQLTPAPATDGVA